MLTIRIKGKYIVLSLVAILLVSVAVYRAAPGLLYARADSLASEGRDELAQQYYDLLISRFPRSDEAARALYFTAQNEAGMSGTGELNTVYIFPSGSGMSGQPRSKEQIISAINKFKLVIERFPDSPWAGHALHEIGSAYYSLGDYASAIQYLSASIEDSSLGKSESTLLLARIYRLNWEYDQALTLLAKSLAEKPGHNPLEMKLLQGQILLETHKLSEAREVFMLLPQAAEDLFTRLQQHESRDSAVMNANNWKDTAAIYLAKIERLQREGYHTGSVSGQVRLGDRGAAQVTVFLLDLAVNTDYYTGNVSDLRQVKTTADGNFVFDTVLSGDYQLAVGVRMNELEGYTLKQVKDKIVVQAGRQVSRDLVLVPRVKLIAMDEAISDSNRLTFAWESVDGAESYDIFFGPAIRGTDGSVVANYTSVLHSGIEGNTLTINMAEEVASSRHNLSIAYDSEGVNPSAILGPLYCGGEFTWGVYAYDGAGNRISDSLGYSFFLKQKDIPLFRVKGQAMSEADRLLLERHFEAAMREYEQQIAENPMDTHSLLILARLHHFGYRPDTRDPAKAITYYERLQQIQPSPELTESIESCNRQLAK